MRIARHVGPGPAPTTLVVPRDAPPADVPLPFLLSPEIPIDVIRLILERLVEGPDVLAIRQAKNGQQSSRTPGLLAACCLVSRSFLDLAREKLYDSVAVPGPFEDGDVVRMSAVLGGETTDGTPRLVHSLADNPHLATLVRRLIFKFHDDEASPPRLAGLLATRLLDLCPGVTQVRVDSPGYAWAAIANALTSRRSRLQRLELVNIVEEPHPGQLGRLVAASLSLKALVLEDVTWAAQQPTISPPPLHHLTIHLPGAPASMLHSLLIQSKHTLSSLSITTNAAHSFRDLRLFTALRDLTVSCWNGPVATDEGNFPLDDSINSELPHLSLARLTLLLPQYPQGDDIAAIILKALPPSLETLRITNVGPKILLPLLESTLNPTLRDVEFLRHDATLLGHHAAVARCVDEPGFLEACAARGMAVHLSVNYAAPVFFVDRADLTVLEEYFMSPDERATRHRPHVDVPWIDFLRSMRGLGFSSRKVAGGTSYKFLPPANIGTSSIVINEPHPDPVQRPNQVSWTAKRLARHYGFSLDMFHLK